MDCVFCINSGGVVVRESVITVKSIPNRLKQKFASVISFPQSSMNFIGCDFIGNETNQTAGILCINGNVQLSNCRFSNFNQGAIHLVNKRYNKVNV
jgi:hypothetical protein